VGDFHAGAVPSRRSLKHRAHTPSAERDAVRPHEEHVIVGAMKS
jgi:hypothetical protein